MHLRTHCRGLTTFQSLVLVALAVIAVSVAYMAFRDPPGSQVLREIDRQMSAGSPVQRAEQARAVAARTDANNLTQALKLYKLDNGQYPTEAQGLAALVQRPAIGEIPNKWRPYLDRLPTDPWRRDYRYKNPGAKAEVEVFSSGPDGQPGTSDDIGP